MNAEMVDLSDKDRDRLVTAVEQAQENAYNPGGTRVGAALLTDSDDIFKGGNVVAMTQDLCAEQNAVVNAVSNGQYSYRAIAVTSTNDKPIPPCGKCRQLLSEFAQIAEHDMHVLMIGSDGSTKQTTISQLLPDAFGPESLGRDLDRYRHQNHE